MNKTALFSTLFTVFICCTYAQRGGDTTTQKRETFVISEEKSGAKESKSKQLVIAVNNFSKKSTSTRRNKFLWNDGHWAGIGLHYSALVTNLGHLNLPLELDYLSQSAKSMGVTLNPIDYTLLKSKHFGLITGLGFEFNNFRFENNITLKQEGGVTLPDYQYEEQHIKLSTSKLFTCYMNVPLLIEVQMGRHNNFFINAGVVGGLRIGVHTKIKANDPRLDGKFKDHSNFGMRNFHYGYTLNFGYSHFGLSATYYRSGLFKDNKGPKVQQINIGLSFLL